jgi:hypothetical protein
MNLNDCQSCKWKDHKKMGYDPGDLCYWMYTEPICNCHWFKYKRKK